MVANQNVYFDGSMTNELVLAIIVFIMLQPWQVNQVSTFRSRSFVNSCLSEILSCFLLVSKIGVLKEKSYLHLNSKNLHNSSSLAMKVKLAKVFKYSITIVMIFKAYFQYLFFGL